MNTYSGLVTLTPEGNAAQTGRATLRASQQGGRSSWQGTFVPADGAPLNGGNATITADDWTAKVLIQNVRYNGKTFTADLLGQGDVPF